MNLALLMAEFRRQANDIVTPYLWSDADIATWFAEAEDEACIRKDLLFDKSTTAICQIAVSEGTASYSLSEYVIWINHAYLTDSSDNVIPLNITDRIEANRQSSDWRTTSKAPSGIIVDDTTVELNCLPEADYTLYLEVYRLPSSPMTEYTTAPYDSPEIAAKHHKHLVKWVLHVALGNRDIDQYAPDISKRALSSFEGYFGKRPDANYKRNNRANVPHIIKAHW